MCLASLRVCAHNVGTKVGGITVRFKFNPVASLVIGSVYLGLAAGIGW